MSRLPHALPFYPLLLSLWLCLLSCGSPGATQGVFTTRISRDRSLTHAVLLLNNPTGHPLTVIFKRIGVPKTRFRIPPLSQHRALVPSGPALLYVKEFKRKTGMRIRSGTRYTLRLSPKSTKEETTPLPRGP